MIEAITREIWTPRVVPPSTVYAETGQSVEAQLTVRYDQTRLVSYDTDLGYTLADDVTLTTINHETPPPMGMRKRF